MIMRWLKFNRDNILNIESLGYGKYALNLSQKDYTSEDEADTNNVQCLQVIVNKYPSTFDIQQELIKLQKEYDEGDEVNAFIVNGVTGWMDKNTRNSLKETLNVVENVGQSTYTLWLGSMSLTLETGVIRAFLNNLELYAIQCYQNTQRHLADIESINNRDDLFKYDISAGYPDKLNITV